MPKYWMISNRNVQGSGSNRTLGKDRGDLSFYVSDSDTLTKLSNWTSLKQDKFQSMLVAAANRFPDVPEAEIIDVATEPALFRLLDAGGADVMVLDGEAQPAGGMGVCRQAKDEIHDCPPVLLIIGRPDDGWLATWSGAEAVVSHPIEPRALATALAGLMRERAGRAAAQA